MLCNVFQPKESSMAGQDRQVKLTCSAFATYLRVVRVPLVAVAVDSTVPGTTCVCRKDREGLNRDRQVTTDTPRCAHRRSSSASAHLTYPG